MVARVSIADAHEADDSPSASGPLPIVSRIRRMPRVDISAILWPIERAARSPQGRSAGKALVTCAFVAVLALFALSNVRSDADREVPAAVAHEATASVHVRRTIAVLPPARPVVRGPSSHPTPAGALSRR